MKLFSTSDIHGSCAIINKLSKIASECDLVLICGDIGGKYRANTVMELSEIQKRDAEYLADALADLPVPSRFILGNDDWFEYAGENYLDGFFQIDGLEFIPFEYVLITPFNTNREVNENKMEYELGKLTAAHGHSFTDSVMVAHMPPYLCGDRIYNGERVGSHAVYNWIEEYQPKLWLCGHIHEDNSAHSIAGTKVFNCASDHVKGILKGWLIDLDTLEYESVEL